MQERMLPDGNFRDRMEAMREKLGLTPAELARVSGLTPTAISRYRSGSRSPSVDELLALSKAFGVKMEWLLCGEEAAPSGPGGPGNAPLYNRGIGARARINKNKSLLAKADRYRTMAEKMETDRKDLLEMADLYEEMAQDALEADDEDEGEEDEDDL